MPKRGHVTPLFRTDDKVSSQDEIEQAHVDFYSSLFSEEPVDMVFQMIFCLPFLASCHLISRHCAMAQ